MQQQLKKLDAPQNSTEASESVSKIKDDETPTKLKKATDQPNKRHWWQKNV